MKPADKLVRMTNHIARNLAIHGEDKAIAATAEHITKFWAPRMREALAPGLNDGCGAGVGLNQKRAGTLSLPVTTGLLTRVSGSIFCLQGGFLSGHVGRLGESSEVADHVAPLSARDGFGSSYLKCLSEVLDYTPRRAGNKIAPLKDFEAAAHAAEHQIRVGRNLRRGVVIIRWREFGGAVTDQAPAPDSVLLQHRIINQHIRSRRVGVIWVNDDPVALMNILKTAHHRIVGHLNRK